MTDTQDTRGALADYDYKAMFEDACLDLAAIHTALGIPDDEAGGAEPILAAIADLQARPASSAQQDDRDATRWKLVPLERSYDMRARAILAFNTATANGADRDDALQAAWEAEFLAAPRQPGEVGAGVPKLKVFYGPMPESNGKSNFTAILYRDAGNDVLDIVDGVTLEVSEYPDRVRYEADRARFLIGELAERPDVLAYDADKHSGYVEASASAQQEVGAAVQCERCGLPPHEHAGTHWCDNQSFASAQQDEHCALREGEPTPPAGPQVPACPTCGGCREWGGNGLWHHAGCEGKPARLESPAAQQDEREAFAEANKAYVALTNAVVFEGDKPRWIATRAMMDCFDRYFSQVQADAGAVVRSEANFDDYVVEQFAVALKRKLADARAKGRGGWQYCDPADLSRMLREHVDKGDPRDVANFSMFLWYHGNAIAAHPSPAGESDKALLDALQNESWDLRSFCIGEEDVGWRVVEFHMAAPHERVIAEVFKDDPRAAIRAAMSREQSQETESGS